jgi:hypothetical protein
MNTKLDPILAPPGAGLPWIENTLARYIFFPKYCRKYSWDECQSYFDKEGEKICSLLDSLTTEKLDQKILIPRIRGIEDSSRFWSVSMTLEHLMIVGRGMSKIIQLLGNGKYPNIEVKTANVKPLGHANPERIREDFKQFLKEFAEDMNARSGDHASELKWKHPWFGGITPFQWHALAGIHQSIHRRQIQEILKKL